MSCVNIRGVLADAKEMLLFCYGSLLRDTGPANIEKLREEIPGLFKLARMVSDKPIKGIHAPKPPNSDAYNEQYVFDFVGMLGLPLVPDAEIRSDAKAAFFSVHALKDKEFPDKLIKMLAEGKPVSDIKNRLGHENVQSTMVYLQMDLSQKRLLQEKFIKFTRQHLMADPKIDELIQWENRKDVLEWLDSL